MIVRPIHNTLSERMIVSPGHRTSNEGMTVSPGHSTFNEGMAVSLVRVHSVKESLLVLFTVH